ncbi:hypothetical protein MMC31_004053 [Peltigera leucophlebia]|nr:hypothetical protein [Peltigera leucophlebia]
MPKSARPTRDGNGLVSHANIFMSIKPEHMANIASGAKNHEYRRYLLSSSISYIWFYTTVPISAIQYVAHISRGKAPGEVPEDGGLGNADFNAGKKQSKFGYEILALWKLEQPITLREAISRGFLKGPPQKYTFVSKQVCGEWELEKQTRVIGKDEAVKDTIKEGKGNYESAMTKGEKEPKKSIGENKITDFFSMKVE